MSANEPGLGTSASSELFAETSYGAYLRLDRILTAQEPRTAVHDELFFIVIHQAFELWFKVLLHELRALRQLMLAGDAEVTTPRLRRITRIQTLLVEQMRLIDTLTPTEFLRFRGALGTASGAESRQFRAIEALLGLRRHDGPVGGVPRCDGAMEPTGTFDAGRRQAESTLDEALWTCFVTRGHLGAAFQGDSAARRTAALALFQSPTIDPALVALCEGLLDVAQGLWLWRATHLTVVDRIIGGRMGTGRTAGAAYLAQTLEHQLFPDLSAAHGSIEQPPA